MRPPSKMPWPLILPFLILGGMVVLLRLTHAEQGASHPTGEEGRRNTGLTEGQQHLLKAVESGNRRTVDGLLREGADPNLQRPILWPRSDKPDSDPRKRYQGDPLLKIATLTRNESMVRLLLKHGAKVNAPGRFGYTPLMAAVDINEPKLVRLLLEHGADSNAMGATRSETPLHLAVSPPNNSGEFMLAPQPGISAAELKRIEQQMRTGRQKIRQRQLTVIRLLLAAGADPMRRDNHDRTPADYARQHKDDELSRLLSSPKLAGKATLPKGTGR